MMKNIYYLLFIIFCLWMAFPITHFQCNKDDDICTCKQYVPLNLEFDRLKEHKLSDIKYSVAFRLQGYSSSCGGKYIGFRYKNSTKQVFDVAMVDERFQYDILTPPANRFVNEFNQYLHNDEKIFDKIHVPSLFIISLAILFVIFIIFK